MDAATLVPQAQASGNTLPPGVSVRFWQPGDTPAIQKIYNDPLIRPGAAMRGYVPRTDAQWSWEFADSHPTNPPYMVATCNDAIIATHACIPIPMLSDGRLVSTGKDEETLVHPDYRGRGVLDAMYRPQLERAVADGFEMLWGFTSTASRSLLRNGFTCLGPFEAMICELSKVRSATSSMEPLHDDDCLRILPCTQADSRFDDLSCEFGRQIGGLTLHLSQSFVDWRVFRNPFRPYAVFSADVDDRLVGLGIFKMENARNYAFLSDLVSIDTAQHPADQIIDRLLSAGVKYLSACGVRHLEARPSGSHPYNRMLQRLLSRRGFQKVPSDRAVRFFVRPVLLQDARIMDQDFWRMCELMREY